MGKITEFLKKKDVEVSLQRYAVDSLNGIAIGIFGSLIIGLILEQIGSKIIGIDNMFGLILVQIGTIAKFVMGAAIGVGVATSLKAPRLVLTSAVGVGMLGAQAKFITTGAVDLKLAFVGDPVGALIATIVAVEFGKLVSGETKIDILLTPAVTLITGGITAIFLGPPISNMMIAIGKFISTAAAMEPISMGIIISVVMGMILTSPMSSAAIAIMLNLSGVAAGAATIGCSTQMIGFAVASYRENGLNGLFAQGIGTAKLQGPNIVKKPIIWLPTIITSAILGPIGTNIFRILGKEGIYNTTGLISNSKGAGMGTCAFVGQLMTFQEMGIKVWPYVLVLHIILPAIITFIISEFMRKKGLISFGDMKLDV